MVTIIDVARLAGVSISTASLALNNKKRVSEATRLKVLSASEQLGYIPNNLAKSLVSKKTGIVGVLQDEIENPYHATLIKYLEMNLRKKNLKMFLAISNWDSNLEKSILWDFISMKVEGILIHTTDIGNFHSYILLDIVKRKIPIVLIGNPTKVAHIPNVFLDLEEGSYNLTRYLIYRGYKKFLYLSGSKKAETFLQRINGHKKALSEAGILVKEEDIVETIPEIDGGYDTTFKLFSKKNFPYDAVICVNDYMALGALKALKELGISIPNQVGVAGYDDVIYSTLSDFPITTVKIPIQEIAQLSTNLLLNQIENKGGEREKLDYVVKTEVVIRDSTR